MTLTGFGSVVFGDAATEGRMVTAMLDLASAAASMADTDVVSIAMISDVDETGIVDAETGTAAKDRSG